MKRPGPGRQRLRDAALVWIPFGGFLLWGWRFHDLHHTIPAYGDVCEVVWAVRWYAESLAAGRDPLHCPLVFHPDGWSVATLAHGPVLIASLLPFHYWGGAAFAFNAAALSSLAVAHAGMRRLALRFVSPAAAVVAALLFTFWGWRWSAIAGHLHILAASALVPWMLLALERGLEGRSGRRGFALAGVVWGLAICCSLYMLWIGALLAITWTAARRPPQLGRARALASLAVTAAVALVPSAPALFWFWRSVDRGGAVLYGALHASHWGASLNSVPIPFVFHPLPPFARLARLVYRGPLDESAIANLGLVAVVLAVVAVARVGRRDPLRRIGLVGVAGVILALGLFLRWDGEFVHLHAAKRIDGALWTLGHALKPGAFKAKNVPRECATAVPLPGLVLAAVVPFWEAARVSSRFIVIAAVPIFLLAAAALGGFRSPAVRWLLTAVLLAETLPAPLRGVPFPPAPHAAFTWLREHPARGGIVDLHAVSGDTLHLNLTGETILATDFHRRRSAAGVGSFMPSTALALDGWLGEHPMPLGNGELATWLHAYRVRFVLLHFFRGDEQRHLDRLNAAFRLQRCFDGPPDPSPWPQRICVLQVRPSAGSRRRLDGSQVPVTTSASDRRSTGGTPDRRRG